MGHATLELIPAPPQRCESLTVFPLLTEGEVELPYLLLADAVADGTLEIREVGSGTVPELLAINRGEKTVLVLDGEQLIGARQNRMPNRTILLPPKRETRIPVSCMERGRWRFTSDAFRAAPQHSPTKVRKRARVHEAATVAEGRDARVESLSDVQDEVWEEIADVQMGLGVRSPTEALDHVYRRREGDLDAWLAAIPELEGQVGLLAFHAGEPLGLDVIGGRELYRRLHSPLVRGYCVDALWGKAMEERRAGGTGAGVGGAGGAAGAGETPDEAEALRYLDAVQRATRSDASTVGVGSYRVLSGEVVGGELEHDGRLVHRAAFPAGESRGRRAGPAADPRAAEPTVAPPSARAMTARPRR